MYNSNTKIVVCNSEITVDMGSNISIVRPDVLRGMSRDLIRPVNSCLRTVTGEWAPIHGKGQLQLRIGSRVISQELWVADIYDGCILGLDFLQVNGCQVNLRDQALVIGDEEVPLQKSSTTSTQNCCRVKLVEKVRLAPLSEAVIPVRVDQGQANYRVGLLEQAEAMAPFGGLLVGWTLVDLTSDRIPLRVMNISRQQTTIPKGAEVCCCDVISAIVTPVEVENPDESVGHVQRVKTLETLPTHLRELYDHSTLGLSEAQQSEVQQLLCSFSDVFLQAQMISGVPT